jgi:NAD(P)H dehydrogenase (quinone)
MIVVTGATGQLGRLVISSLLKRVPANRIVAAARTPSKAADLAALGVEVREADYGKPATLAKAFARTTSLLLFSSPPTPAQLAEHKAVIDAAKNAGVRLLAYTSVLRADTSTLLVAPHHLATEQYLAASGIPWVFLRHPSYVENYTASLASAVEHGAIAGSAGDGRNSAATRADLAEAAAVVLTTPDRAGKIYELGSDIAFTMAEFAAEVSQQSGKRVVYNNLPQQDYRALLESVGVPATFANLVADSDVKAASRNELYTASRDLSGIIGHPTTTLSGAIAAALPRQVHSIVE